MDLEAWGRASSLSTAHPRVRVGKAFAHQKTDFFHVRVRGGLAGGQPPANDDGDAIGNLEQLVDILGDQQNGSALIAQRQQ
jgi:hypothetical protein